MMNIKEQALSLANQGFKVFQLSQNSKIPLKNTHGYKDATNSLDEIRNVFKTFNNLGLALSANSLVLVDIDTTNQEQLKKVLAKLSSFNDFELPQTYTEQTISGGLHFIYKTDKPLKPTNKTLFSLSKHAGVEIRTDGVIIAPSCINGRSYKPISDIRLTDAKTAPEWIYSELNHNSNNSIQFQAKVPTRKYYTGKKLDEIVKGTGQGNRNNWLTSVTGWLFRTGADPETVYQLLHLINANFIEPPLKDKEVNSIFKSILRRLAD